MASTPDTSTASARPSLAGIDYGLVRTLERPRQLALHNYRIASDFSSCIAYNSLLTDDGQQESEMPRQLKLQCLIEVPDDLFELSDVAVAVQEPWRVMLKAIEEKGVKFSHTHETVETRAPRAPRTYAPGRKPGRKPKMATETPLPLMNDAAE